MRLLVDVAHTPDRHDRPVRAYRVQWGWHLAYRPPRIGFGQCSNNDIEATTCSDGCNGHLATTPGGCQRPTRAGLVAAILFRHGTAALRR